MLTGWSPWQYDTTGPAGNDLFVLCCHQNEVTLLRNEVAQLKQLLLAHKDCPVTIMQKKAAFLGKHLSSLTIFLHCVTSFVRIHLSSHSSNVLFLPAHLSKGECFCLPLAAGGEETSRDASAEPIGSPAAVIQHGPSPPTSVSSPGATINGLSVRAAEAVAMSVLAGMGSGQPGGIDMTTQSAPR